ncbi:MAG: hypothetical protein NTY31_00750 [Candidatus Falkowbacteria bacterium]|nr:hypothetical protein [Candidatus Falkowbacteria bacterium]
MFSLPANFIGIYKIGDNINYNLRILNFLYELNNSPIDNYKKELLHKPIIIIMASIGEAILYDFHFRIKIFTIEGVNNLAKEVISYIRNKEIDEFEKLITSVKKHNLFGIADNIFYEKLDFLRQIRNRIHIQNKKRLLPADEHEIFTQDNVELAELILEKIIKTMIVKFPRNIESSKYVSDFILPWNEYLRPITTAVKYTQCPYCLFDNIDDGSGMTQCWCGKIY